MANDMNKSIMSAIQTIVDNSVKNIIADATYTVTIDKLIDADKNEYSVIWEGGTVRAFAENGQSYNEGDTVYMKVPQKNPTNKKIIESKIKGNETAKKIEDDVSYLDSNSYLPIGSNLITIDVGNEIGLHSQYVSDNCMVWASEEYLANNIDILKNDIKFKDQSFIDTNAIELNRKDSVAIKLKANIQTVLPPELRSSPSGLFGLILEVVLKDESKTNGEKIEFFSLTSRDIIGNPFALNDGKNCERVFAINKGNFLRINNIIAFSRDFVGETKEDAMLDIYFRNLEITLLEKNESIYGDYALITTTTPSNILINDERHRIEANMYYKNTKLTSNCTYRWGIENLLVDSKSKLYSPELGNGWELLKADSNILNINSKMCPSYENMFKIVCTYTSESGNTTIAREVKILNSANQMDVRLESDKGTSFQFDVGSTTLTCRVFDEEGKETTDTYRYIWSKSDSSGKTIYSKTFEEIKDEEDRYLAEITSSDNKLDSLGRDSISVIQAYSKLKRDYETVTHKDNYVYSNKITVQAKGLSNLSATNFKCTVQRLSSTWITVGSKEITLTNDNSTNASLAGKVIIDNDSQVFQYDESGISPNDESKQNPIEVRWLKARFYDISETEVDPELWDYIHWLIPNNDTLIEKPLSNIYLQDEDFMMYKANGVEYPLAISKHFNSSYTNNQIECVISYQGEEYRGKTNLYFTKIGEVGTNGTNTVVKISENKDSNFRDKHIALIKDKVNENTWFWNVGGRNIPHNEYEALKAELYTSGEKLFGYTPQWTPAGMSGHISKEMTIKGNDSENSNGGCIVEMGGKDHKDNVRIASAKITIDNKTYYSSYPIYTIEYFGDYNYDVYPIDVKMDTLQSISYDSSGANPQFNGSADGKIHLGLDGKFKDGETQCSIAWAAKGGPETDKGTNPAIKLSRTCGATVGSNELEPSVDERESNDVIGKIRYIKNSAAAISNDDHKKRTETTIYLIEKQFTNTLTLGTRSRVLKAEELNEQLRKEIKDFSDNDKVVAYSIVNTYKEIFDKITEQLNNVTNISEDNMTVYDKIFLIFQKYQELERTLYVTDYTHDSYVGNVTDFWNNLIAELNKCCNEAENAVDFNKFKEACNFYNSILIEEIFGTNKGNNEIREDNRTFFIKFRAQFESIVPTTQELVSSYGQHLISYLTDGEVSFAQPYVYIVPGSNYNGIYCNNRVEAFVYILNNLCAKVTIPIHMFLNVYELASVNGWDGTHVEINEEDDYVLAPQIGAGVKNQETNTFTGLVMGSLSNKTESGYSDEKVGLMGFSDGQQSIFLDAKTGSATFGLASDGADSNNLYTEGRIKLVPGGVSEISKWRIGRDSIYNVVDGYVDRPYEELEGDYISTYGLDNNVMVKENRSISAPRGAQKSIPHDKQGIMLSADPSYISVKGRPLTVGPDDTYDVNTSEGVPILVDGNSLEVEIDPNARSLFTIYRHAQTTDGLWFREAQVGIDNRGRFYSNSLKDNGTALGISEIAAFGRSEDEQAYRGLQIEAGVSNDETYPVAKLFTKIVDSGEEYQTTPLYLSGAYNGYENEYSRPIGIYGREIYLYAQDTSGENNTEEQSKHFIKLYQDDSDTSNKSIIEITTNVNSDYIKMFDKNLDIKMSGSIDIESGNGMTLETTNDMSFVHKGNSGITIKNNGQGGITIKNEKINNNNATGTGNIVLNSGANANLILSAGTATNDITNTSNLTGNALAMIYNSAAGGGFYLGSTTGNNFIPASVNVGSGSSGSAKGWGASDYISFEVPHIKTDSSNKIVDISKRDVYFEVSIPSAPDLSGYLKKPNATVSRLGEKSNVDRETIMAISSAVDTLQMLWNAYMG